MNLTKNDIHAVQNPFLFTCNDLLFICCIALSCLLCCQFWSLVFETHCNHANSPMGFRAKKLFLSRRNYFRTPASWMLKSWTGTDSWHLSFAQNPILWESITSSSHPTGLGTSPDNRLFATVRFKWILINKPDSVFTPILVLRHSCVSEKVGVNKRRK